MPGSQLGSLTGQLAGIHRGNGSDRGRSTKVSVQGSKYSLEVDQGDAQQILAQIDCQWDCLHPQSMVPQPPFPSSGVPKSIPRHGRPNLYSRYLAIDRLVPLVSCRPRSSAFRGCACCGMKLSLKLIHGTVCMLVNGQNNRHSKGNSSIWPSRVRIEA